MENATEVAQTFCQEFRPTIWHRLGFGHAGVAPWNDDDGTAHYIVTDTVAVFDWLDRLRILLTGRVHVATRTRTEVPVGKAETRGSVKVLGWGWTL